YIHKTIRVLYPSSTHSHTQSHSQTVYTLSLHDALPISHRPKLTVMDTMNFWIDTALDDLKEIISKVDVIAINDSEARQLTDEYSLVKAAEKIKKMGPDYVVIKKREHEALRLGEGRDISAPALP